MKKFLLSMAAVGMALSVSAETVTITTTETKAANSSTSYVTTYFDVPVGAYNFKFCQLNPSTGQMRVNNTNTSAFNLYNTTPLEGLESIVITASAGTLGTWYMATSNTAEVAGVATTSDIAGTVDATNNTVSFSVPAGVDASYFHINLTTKGSGTVNLKKIEIKFAGGGVVLLPAELSFPETEYTVNLGEAFTAPVLTKATDAAASYTSSDETVATVDAATGAVTVLAAGITTITATTAETAAYREGKASYTLTVVDPSQTKVDFDWSEYGYDNGADVEGETIDPVVIALSKGEGSNQPKYYTTGTGIRMYVNNTMTVSVPDGYSIEMVEFKTQEGYALAASTTATPGTLADGVWTASAPTTKVVFTMGGTCRIQNTIVYYSKSDIQKEASGLAFPEASYDVVFGEAFTSPELTKATDGAITYTSSDEAVATVDAEGKVSILSYGKTVITATSAETEKYYAGEASYTLNVLASAASINDIYEIAGDDKNLVVAVNFPATVTYQSDDKRYTYIESNGEYSLIFSQSGANMTAYSTGDVIPAGWSCKYAPYNKLPELVPVEYPAAATETAAAAPTVVKEISLDMVNQIVVFERLSLDNDIFADSSKSASFEYYGEDIQLYNQFGLATQAAGEYDLLGAVSRYQDTVQVYPILFATAGTLGVGSIEAEGADEAIYYNLQGARVANPEKGIFVRIQGGKAVKVVK